jgi:hypothetical protein
MWIIVVSITIFLFWVGEKGKTLKLGTLDDASFAQDVNTFAQIAGILVAATMIVVTNRRNARQADETSRTQIYQALELESIALFRFESGNTAVARAVWESDAMPSGDGAIDAYQVKEYICQGTRTIYISGQVSIDEGGTLVGAGDLAAQTTQAMHNVGLAFAHRRRQLRRSREDHHICGELCPRAARRDRQSASVFFPERQTAGKHPRRCH